MARTLSALSRHRDLDLAGPLTPVSISTLSSSAKATARAASSSSAASTLDTPTLEPARAGFTNTGRPSSAARARTTTASRSQSVRRNRHPGSDRDAGGLERDLHEVLVHAECGVEDPTARVRDLQRVEEALDGAVLAVRSMQDRQHHVDLSQPLDGAVRLHDAQRAVTARSGQSTRVPLSTTSGRCAASSGNFAGSSSSRTNAPSRVIPTGITA